VETGAHNRPIRTLVSPETEKAEQCRPNSRQKRPLSWRGQFRRFETTEWWGPSEPNCLLPTQSIEPVSQLERVLEYVSVSLILKSHFETWLPVQTGHIMRDQRGYRGSCLSEMQSPEPRAASDASPPICHLLRPSKPPDFDPIVFAATISDQVDEFSACRK
jgi:hypothetical protein